MNQLKRTINKIADGVNPLLPYERRLRRMTDQELQEEWRRRLSELGPVFEVQEREILADPAGWVQRTKRKLDAPTGQICLLVGRVLNKADAAGEFAMPGEVKNFLAELDETNGKPKH